MLLGDRVVRRPPRWLRIVAGVGVAYSVAKIFTEQVWTERAWGVLMCLLALSLAIAPRGLYDGRFQAWLDLRPVLNGVLGFVVVGGLAALLLVEVVNWQLAVAGVVPVGAIAVAVVLRKRPASEKSGES